MKGDRRGRSKTKKICSSSDMSQEQSDKSKQKQRIDDGTKHANTGLRAPPAENKYGSNRHGKSGLNPTTPVHTPYGDNLERLRNKTSGTFDIRSPIEPKHSVLSSSHRQELFGHLEGTRDENTEQSSLRTSNVNSLLASWVSIVPEKINTFRSYYNDFTTIDWVKAFIQTNRFNYEVSHRKWFLDEFKSDDSIGYVTMPVWYQAYYVLGKWVLILLIGFTFALIAFTVDKFEVFLVGFKDGLCKSNWWASKESCCASILQSHTSAFFPGEDPNDIDTSICPDWILWSEFIRTHVHKTIQLDLVIYVTMTVLLAYVACEISLTTRLSTRLSPFPKLRRGGSSASSFLFNSPPAEDVQSSAGGNVEKQAGSERVLYTACGSGVPEVRTILSGFVIRRFLGTYTLIAKTIALIFAIASGMSLGKEGPYVHLATCVGNILSRLFPYINNNVFMKKQILTASASSGVALAFGSPLGGVLFALEEINNYLPTKHLFQVFFLAIMSSLFLKLLDPYGTGQTVLFELKYSSDWKSLELLFFVLIGISGGIFGAMFIKFVRWWPTFFRSIKFIKNHARTEVVLVAFITGITTFWGPLTKKGSSELVSDIATSCKLNDDDSHLCPRSVDDYRPILIELFQALILKSFLTFITFGIKVPSGIYVPSMVVGALYGRMFATFIQWINVKYDLRLFVDMQSVLTYSNTASAPDASKNFVDLGIYSMISAGAFMAGVTRMNITLVVILFELTSSYTYVVPIAISISVANWMGSILEEHSLYDSLLIGNNYPFLSPDEEILDPYVSAAHILPATDFLHDDKMEGTDINTTSQHDIKPHDSHFVNQTSSTVPEPLQFSMECHEDDKLFIDITESPYVLSHVLESKLILLAEKSLLDGCIALIKDKSCVGLFFFPDVELLLDKYKEFRLRYNINDPIYCKVNHESQYFQSEALHAPLNHNLSILKRIEGNLAGDMSSMDYFSYGSIPSHSHSLIDKEVKELPHLMESLTNLTPYIDFNPICLNYTCELSLAHLIFERVGNRVLVLLKDGKFYGVLLKKVFIDYCRRDEGQ